MKKRQNMFEGFTRRTFGGSSGTYNVQASEIARNQNSRKTFNVNVKFLNNSQETFQLKKNEKGIVLLEQVFRSLDIKETCYFGLQYIDNNSLPFSSNNIMKWLKPAKPLKKQSSGPYFFRVKFYVTDPCEISEEFDRYQFVLQIRKDIVEGKLRVLSNEACLLASYIVQAEIGDYDSQDLQSNYLPDIDILPNQSEEMKQKVAELHKSLKGQTPAVADLNFLNQVKHYDTYGVWLFKAIVRCILILSLMSQTNP